MRFYRMLGCETALGHAAIEYPRAEHPSPYVRVPFYDDEPDIEDASQLSDFIGLGVHFAISYSALSLLSRLKLDPAIEFTRVDVLNRRGVVLQIYHAMDSDNLCRVIDRYRAKYETIKNRDVIVGVEHWVLSRKLLPPYDLFLAEFPKWIASEKVYEAVQSANLTGGEFVEVDVSD